MGEKEEKQNKEEEKQNTMAEWAFEAALREVGANPSSAARRKAVAAEKARYPKSQGVVFMADAMLQVLNAAAPSTSDGDGSASAPASTATAAAAAAPRTARVAPAPPAAAVKVAVKAGKRTAKTKEQLAREAKDKLVAKLAADRLKAEEKRKKRKAEAAAKKVAAKRQRLSGVSAVIQKKAGAANDGGTVVLLLGVLGCGKGTQGALLSSKLGWTHLSCGEILRTTRNSSGERGQRMKAALDHDKKLRAEGECSFMYRYSLRESCSQFDSLPLTSLTIPPTRKVAAETSRRTKRTSRFSGRS